MRGQLEDIVHRARAEGSDVVDRSQCEPFKASLVGPHGSFTQLARSVGKLPNHERPEVGKLINTYKQVVEGVIEEVFQRVHLSEQASRLGLPIDPSLPSPDTGVGTHHPLSQVRRRISDIFHRIGFVTKEGPEVDTEWFCFDALNTPECHPARAEKDTLYLNPNQRIANTPQKSRERYLLRTQTSTVQVRTLLQESPPLRIISPGRAFRRDTVDATHSANFHQVEGLYMDRHVTVKDLKAVLDYFIHCIFGKEVKTRFRSSFFPFTEPSFEMDIQSPNLGKISNQWIEIMGCGMVDPAVFEAVGYDPLVWRGYAFGMGIERIAMILFGIDDIRRFYQNDLRFLKQFQS